MINLLFLGSDCHNVDNRKPNLIAGYDYISDKYGQKMVEQIDNLGKKCLDLIRNKSNRVLIK